MRSPSPEELLARALTVPAEDADDEVRSRILDAAAQGFREGGIRRTSVNDIARRAGVGRMTVYRRFPHREQLVTAALLFEARQELRALGRALSALDDIEEQLVEGFVRGVETSRGHPLFVRLRETEPEDVALRLTIRGASTLDLVRTFVVTLLDAGVATGRLRPMDTHATAEILARVALSLVTMPATALPVDDRDALREFARAHVLPLVAGRTPVGVR